MLILLGLALASLVAAFIVVGLFLSLFVYWVKSVMYKNKITWNAAYRLIASSIPMKEWSPVP
jgi:hypothetical protein